MSDVPHDDIQRALARQRAAPQSRAFAPLAAAYRAGGDLAAAVQVLEDGLVLHARYVGAWVLLAECQRELGDEDSAEATFARVLDLDADNLVALRFRAQRAQRRGALDRAVDSLRRAMEIDPFDRDIQADLGLVTAALDRNSRQAAVPWTVAPEPPSSPPTVHASPPQAPAQEPSRAPVRVPSFEPEPAPFAQTPPPPAPSVAVRREQPSADLPLVAPPPASAAPPRAAPAPPPAETEWAPPWIEPRPELVAPVPPRPAPVAPPAPFEWRPPAAWPPPAEPAVPASPMPERRVEPEFEWRATAPGAAAPPEPPPIDLRRVGRPQEPLPPPPPPPAPAERPIAAAEQRSPWHFTRQDDRIVVAPVDSPVRGPIRSVEDRLFAEQRGLPGWPEDAAAESPVEAAPETPPALVPAVAAQFATLTLAGIYESQGYLHKALAIYDELQRAHPQDPTIASRLANLQRRLAGAEPVSPASAAALPPQAPPPRSPVVAPPPVALTPPAADESVAWRLLDSTTLGDPLDTASRLRRATAAARTQAQARQHTVHGAPDPIAPAPVPMPPPPPAEPSGGHEDYERFLRYLRSLKP